MKKNPSHQLRLLQGNVPVALGEAFDATAERLGMMKQRVLAAAVDAFIHCSRAEQFRQCASTYLAYYATDADATDPEATDADAAEAVMLEEVGKRVKRKSAAKRGRRQAGG